MFKTNLIYLRYVLTAIRRPMNGTTCGGPNLDRLLENTSCFQSDNSGTENKIFTGQCGQEQQEPARLSQYLT